MNTRQKILLAAVLVSAGFLLSLKKVHVGYFDPGGRMYTRFETALCCGRARFSSPALMLLCEAQIALALAVLAFGAFLIFMFRSQENFKAHPRSEELERLWQTDANWTRWGFYKCAQDPRPVVPKRVKWAGWTMNIAHAFCWPAFLLIIIIAVAPPLAAVYLCPQSRAAVFSGAAISLALVSAVCVYLAKFTE